MKQIFIALLLAVIPQAVCAFDAQWLRENCPNCKTVSDGHYLLPFQGQFVKFSLKLHENRDAYHLDLVWEGLADETGRVTRPTVTFTSELHRDRVWSEYAGLCQQFTGYAYYSSEFTGNHWDLVNGRSSTGKLQQTCFVTFADARRYSANRAIRIFQSIFGTAYDPNAAIFDGEGGKEVQIIDSARPKGQRAVQQ